MAKIDLTKYGITGTTEIVYNPSYETLFEEETKPELEGFEKAQSLRWSPSRLRAGSRRSGQTLHPSWSRPVLR